MCNRHHIWKYLDWNGHILGRNLVFVVFDKLYDGQHVIHTLDNGVFHSSEILPLRAFTYDVHNGLVISETDVARDLSTKGIKKTSVS